MYTSDCLIQSNVGYSLTTIIIKNLWWLKTLQYNTRLIVLRQGNPHQFVNEVNCIKPLNQVHHYNIFKIILIIAHLSFPVNSYDATAGLVDSSDKYGITTDSVHVNTRAGLQVV